MLDVFCLKRNGHALLRLGDCQLSAIKTVILLRNSIQVDVKAVGKLANSNRDTAGTKVVAALNELASVFTAEEALKLALNRGVALLDLGSVALNGASVVGLGRTSCATNAITTSAAAEKDDDIAIFRTLAADVALRSGAYNSTNLHAFCNVAWVVELRNLARSKANLIAVAGITCSRRANDGALGKLSRKGLRNRNSWICGAGDAHCLVDVATARKGIADRAADTGSCATKRLNLGWVVVSLVLEEEEPVFVVAVNVYLYLYGTGINLF